MVGAAQPMPICVTRSPDTGRVEFLIDDDLFDRARLDSIGLGPVRHDHIRLSGKLFPSRIGIVGNPRSNGDTRRVVVSGKIEIHCSSLAYSARRAEGDAEPAHTSINLEPPVSEFARLRADRTSHFDLTRT